MKSKAIICCRVSTKEQEETGYSLPAQEKLLKESAEKKDFIVNKVFLISESASGKKQREIFMEMIVYAKRNDIKILMFEKADRVTRNFKDMVMIDDWLDQDEERQVHLVKDGLVLHKNSRSNDKLNWGIRILFAKNYIDNLSEEVKKGQKEKLTQGWRPAKPILGYKSKGDKGHKTHVIDEKSGPFVKRMFEYEATGNFSLIALTEKMYSEGLRSKAGGKVVKSRVEEMLKDPFYYGAMKWKEAFYPNGKHEPLVSKEIFDKVQDVLTRKNAPHYRSHNWVFKKAIKCGECGGSVSGDIHKGHIYYSCKHYRPCTQKGGSKEEEVERQLMGVLKLFSAITFAPPAGFEPATNRLTGDCSTAELQGNVHRKWPRRSLIYCLNMRLLIQISL
jgi:site-specific DNA recombinase